MSAVTDSGRSSALIVCFKLAQPSTDIALLCELASDVAGLSSSYAATASRQAVGGCGSQSGLHTSQPTASHAVLQSATNLWANSAVIALLDGTERLTDQCDDLLARQLECMQPAPGR